jgi:hypothetical protein
LSQSEAYIYADARKQYRLGIGPPLVALAAVAFSQVEMVTSGVVPQAFWAALAFAAAMTLGGTTLFSASATRRDAVIREMHKDSTPVVLRCPHGRRQ